MNDITLLFLLTHLLSHQDSGRKCWGIEILAQILHADSSPPQCQLRRSLIERVECYPHTRPVHRCISHLLCLLPPHIVHKLVDGARCTCTSNPPFSRYHTDTQGSPSVGQWKTVAMAAHPEPCYHMIWGVMPLNQPPFLFSALLPRRCWCRVEIQNGIQSPAPQLCTAVLPSHLPPYRWYIDDVRMHGIIFYIQFNLQHLRVRLQTQLIRWI